MAKLTFVLEDGQDVVVPIAERVSLGRDDGNDVVVDDQRISARHAELIRQPEGGFEVRDLDSKAGTFVNGERVAQRHPIRSGDKIAFGPLIAVFHLDDAGVLGGGNGVVRAAKVLAPGKAAAKADKAPVAKRGDRDLRRESRTEIVPKSRPGEVPPAPVLEPVAPEPVLPLKPKEETAAELYARLEADQRTAIEKLEKDKLRLQGEVDAMQKALRDWQDRAAKAQDVAHGEQRRLDEVRQDLAGVQAELKIARAQDDHLQSQLREAANELSVKGVKVEKLRAEEQRLKHVTDALRDAESSHAQWIEAINTLSSQHDQKHAEVLRLGAASESALREVETMKAHKTEALAHLKQLRMERESGEAHLSALRQQVAGFEARSQEVKMLAEAREDQVKSAEKRLEQLDRQRAQLEAQIKQLSGVEDRLQKARAQFLEVEARHGTVSATLAGLNEQRQRAEEELAGLVSRIGALRSEHEKISSATEEARTARQGVEEALRGIHAEREQHETHLTGRRQELAQETKKLEEIRAERARLEAQCEALSATDGKLSAAREELARGQARIEALNAEIKGLEDRKEGQKLVVSDLAREEDETKERLKVLRGRETDLRAELDSLSESEREHRERFEEVRRLTTEAEKEFAALQSDLARKMEDARRELAEMEIKLAPLRDWKQAMDQRYARLAALPEDSTEARALWREIETEKSNLKSLISAGPGQAPASAPSESVLRTIVENAEKKPAAGKGTLHAPPGLTEEAETPGQRGNAGPSGTGAMHSGTGQEMALKARVSRLRESVQREAMRLEFLRQERAREESRTKGGPPSESMMREQDRQLETKIRREEERFATLQRKMELAEVEEEKRREKIAEMERKIAELRSDISEAERLRSDLRHQADLVQTELRNYEAVLDRVKKKAD